MGKEYKDRWNKPLIQEGITLEEHEYAINRRIEKYLKNGEIKKDLENSNDWVVDAIKRRKNR